jgi:hypothetical protein
MAPVVAAVIAAVTVAAPFVGVASGLFDIKSYVDTHWHKGDRHESNIARGDGKELVRRGNHHRHHRSRQHSQDSAEYHEHSKDGPSDQ